MEDLISKQAAIDAVEDYFGGLPIQGRYDILQIIKRLPSAEPQIVRCGECWRRNKEDYCPLVIDGCYPPDLPDDWFCADGERRADE